MPFDALTIEYLARELNDTLRGGRLDKIAADGFDGVTLYIRAHGQNLRLLLSAAAHNPRAYLSCSAAVKAQDAANPPPFVMHLRRHIGGGMITGVESMPFERVLTVKITRKNELFVDETFSLTTEIMGKHSNIILIGGDGKIRESIKHVLADTSRKRQVFPSLPYSPPPAQERISILPAEELSSRLSAFKGGRIDEYLSTFIAGLSARAVSEAVFTAFGAYKTDNFSSQKAAQLIDALQGLYTRSPAPCALGEVDFFPFALNSEKQTTAFATLSSAAEFVLGQREKRERFMQKYRTAEARLRGGLKAAEKKLGLALEQVNSAADAEKWKRLGELLINNIYRVKKGDEKLIAPDYYNNGTEVEIVLDRALSPEQNAQLFFKRYNKKKRAAEHAEATLTEVRAEAERYYSLLTALGECKDENSITALFGESGGEAHRKRTSTTSSPHKFEIGGFDVLVGKNNAQNDILTLKTAAPHDVFLHARNIPGSHVIIVTARRTVPHDVLLEAAKLAAKYSKARGGKIEVDYCDIRFVRKPKGNPPGKVTYTGQKTLVVDI